MKDASVVLGYRKKWTWKLEEREKNEHVSVFPRYSEAFITKLIKIKVY